MIRLFFDIHECGRDAVTDCQGLEVVDLAAARQLAIETARGIMAEEVRVGHLCLGCTIAVRNECGEPIMAVSFADAVTITFTNDC